MRAAVHNMPQLGCSVTSLWRGGTATGGAEHGGAVSQLQPILEAASEAGRGVLVGGRRLLGIPGAGGTGQG